MSGVEPQKTEPTTRTKIEISDQAVSVGIDALAKLAQALPELRSVMVVFDWDVGGPTALQGLWRAQDGTGGYTRVSAGDIALAERMENTLQYLLEQMRAVKKSAIDMAVAEMQQRVDANGANNGQKREEGSSSPTKDRETESDSGKGQEGICNTGPEESNQEREETDCGASDDSGQSFTLSDYSHD